MWRRFSLLLITLGAISSIPFLGGASCSSPHPASPPAPPAEIPAFLVIPSSIRIDVSTNTPPALNALAGEGPLQEEIDASIQFITRDYELFDSVLAPFENSQIPVDPSITTYEAPLPFQFDTFDFKFDFRPFDFDGDGVPEDCSGCTCPVGCAPSLSQCPSEAPEDQLKPICLRIWVGGKRFMAGLFKRVPTKDNPESGVLRVLFPAPTDLPGSQFATQYDFSNPENKSIDQAGLIFDDGLQTVIERTHGISSIEGPADMALFTGRASGEFAVAPTESMFHSQSEFFTQHDLLTFELITSGVYADQLFGTLDDVTPPICAEISMASPVADILCSDLGLALTPGNFPTLPEVTDVELPPTSEFPEVPTF